MFLRSVTGAAESRWRARLVVVPTLRGDFYSHLAEDRGARRAVRRQSRAVRSDELGRASACDRAPRSPRRRARRIGPHGRLDCRRGRGARGSAAAFYRPGRAMGCARRRLAHAGGLRSVRGVRGAVARLAERSFEQLSEMEQEAARRVLLRLVGTGEGDTFLRRRVATAEFDLDRDTVARSVLDRFTQDPTAHPGVTGGSRWPTKR